MTLTLTLQDSSYSWVIHFDNYKNVHNIASTPFTTAEINNYIITRQKNTLKK